MSRKQLLITCSGGLGNRLTGLVSGMVLAERHDMELLACWPLGHGLTTGAVAGFTCPLEAIVAPPCTLVPVQERDQLLKTRHEHFSLERQKCVLFYLGEHELTYCWAHGPIRNAAITDQEMQKHFRRLHFTQAVHDYVTKGHLKLEQRRGYVGGLVRCKGHGKTKGWRPVQRFDRLIATLNNPFYLCCDDPTITQQMLQRHKNAVTLEKPTKHNTQEAIIIVMAEILLMAQADKFYGSYWSMLNEPVRLLRDDLTCTIPE